MFFNLGPLDVNRVALDFVVARSTSGTNPDLR